MIRLSAIKLHPEHTKDELIQICASKLGLHSSDIKDLKILRRSIEARKKEPLSYVYTLLLTVEDEQRVVSFLQSKKGSALQKKHSIQFQDIIETYRFPIDSVINEIENPPVVIGSGPAGLLCAYELASHGFRPLVIERGLPVEERVHKVKEFWEKGSLDPECNVQFGEGGAGTFSDGKLNTGVTDRFHRTEEVLCLFVSCGAPEEILYDAKPHIGSDVLYEMIPRVREKIQSLGGTFLYGKKAENIVLQDDQLKGIILSDGSFVQTSTAVFAIGHSARDTFQMLYDHGVKMSAKAFAVGVRCEHDQEMINQNQWGQDYPKSLGAAPYKLTYKTKEGRSVYTFCMCPGGYVVNASSEKDALAVNGMSLSKRDSGKANSAVIVSVTPDDYQAYQDENMPQELLGIAFQRDLERKAFAQGNGNIPVSVYGDFKKNTISDPSVGSMGCHKGKVHPADLHQVLPEYICNSLIEGIENFDRKIKGFAADDTLLYAVESRTSSPVRILRDETFQSNIKGLFPCGEGAGYAGGIMSAAIDGIKTAEAVAYHLTDFQR